ncbi:unnamed protein product, partial [Wuchereria bancrofti]
MKQRKKQQKKKKNSSVDYFDSEESLNDLAGTLPVFFRQLLPGTREKDEILIAHSRAESEVSGLFILLLYALHTHEEMLLLLLLLLFLLLSKTMEIKHYICWKMLLRGVECPILSAHHNGRRLLHLCSKLAARVRMNNIEEESVLPY